MKTYTRYATVATALLCLVALFLSPATQAQSAKELMDRFPVDTSADLDSVCATLLQQTGVPGLKEVCASVAPLGAGDDSKARCALMGMAHFVMKPGQDINRRLFVETVSAALANPVDKEVKVFYLEVLSQAGDDSCVPAVAACITEEALSDPAARTLATLATPTARGALLGALPGAKDGVQASILQAIATLRDTRFAEAVLPLAGSADLKIRESALLALAEMPSADAAETLLAAAAAAPSATSKATALSYCLRYAARMNEIGKEGKASAMCDALLTKYVAPEDLAVRCAALGIKAAAEGKKSLDTVVAAMGDTSIEYRAVALKSASLNTSEKATKKWASLMKDSTNPQIRAEIVTMLGRRGDESVLSVVMGMINDEEKYVRLAAMEAATRLGGAASIAPIIGRMNTEIENDELKAAVALLLQLPTADVTAACAGGLPKAKSPAAAKAFIDVLAARRNPESVPALVNATADPDLSVRVAAIEALALCGSQAQLPVMADLVLNAREDKDATAARKGYGVLVELKGGDAAANELLARIEKATPEARARILLTLALVGGDKPLEIVVADCKSENTVVRDAAVRALANWPTADAIRPQLAIIKEGKDATHATLALRGFIRLTGDPSAEPDDRLDLYSTALDLATQPEERSMAISGIGTLHTMTAVQFCARLLKKDDLKADAAAAIASIVLPVKDDDFGIRDAEAAPIIKEALPLVANKEVAKELKEHLALIPVADEDGFVPLFNGEDLAGWIGDTKGYQADNGVLICKPGGNLYTDREYADFVFRFEFKFTPGANNGLGLRLPRGGATFDGMEIQILDDGHEQYKNIKEWQAHGSVYGVAPARRGCLKPTGEWNFEEVTMKGTHITVKVNDKTIVKTDLAKVKQPYIDEREHPGLLRPSGYIAFLGHGSVLEFRNIKIKELK